MHLKGCLSNCDCSLGRAEQQGRHLLTRNVESGEVLNEKDADVFLILRWMPAGQDNRIGFSCSWNVLDSLNSGGGFCRGSSIDTR